RLRRWIKLSWKSHDLSDSSSTVVNGLPLPIARSRAQLELSFVAVAILSERPDESFLSDLAYAWATDHLSTQRHFFPKRPNGPLEEVHDISCKDLHRNLGPLLRWRYTEAVQPKIQLLEESCKKDMILVKGFQFMAQAFHEFGWFRSSI